MSASTGTRKERNVETRATDALTQIDNNFINDFKVFTNVSSPVAGSAGSAAGSISNTSTGNFLAKKGDAMIGPLALDPPTTFSAEVDSNNTIDIGPFNDNPQFSSNLLLDDLQPNSSVLDIIANPQFDGQILLLKTFAPTVAYTLRQGTVGNGGNIQTGDGNDLTVGDLQTVFLIYDDDLVINGGTWRIVSVSNATGGGGVSFPIDFPEEADRGTVTTTQTVTFTNSTRHSVAWTIGAADVAMTMAGLTANTLQITSITVKQDATGGRNISFTDTIVNAATIIAAFAASDPLAGISFIIESERGILTAYLKTGNVVSGGGVSALSGLTIDVNKDWLALGISNVGDLTGVTNIDLDGSTATIQGVKTIQFFDDSPNKTMTTTANSVDFNTAALDQFSFFANAIEMVRIEEVTTGVYKLNMLVHSIDNAKDIVFDDSAGAVTFAGTQPAVGYDSAATRLILNMPSSANLFVTNNNAIGSTQMNNNTITSNIVNASDVLQLGVDVTTPTVVGEFRNGGTDVTVFSGGAVRNLSNITTTASATIELDNLGTTAINANLLFDAATYDIGDATNRVANLNVNTIRLRTSTGVGNIPSIYSTATTVLDLNVPLLGTMALNVNAVPTYTWSPSAFTAPNVIVSNTLTLNDNTSFPTLSGQFARNGTITSVFAPIFEIKNDTSVSLEQATIHLTKVDTTPLANERVAEIDFIVRDSGTEVTYAQISSIVGDPTDFGILNLSIRANNATAAIALSMVGDDNNVQYAFRYTDESRVLPISGNMLFSVRAITAVANFGSNIGTEGTMIIPFINNGSPNLSDLNSAFGAFDGAIGVDVNDDKLYVRTGSSTWAFYSASGTVTT